MPTRFVNWSVAFSLMLLTACSAKPGDTIKVKILSDYVAGPEAALATVDLMQGDIRSPALRLFHAELSLSADMSLAEGLQVGEFKNIPAGTYTLRGQLFRADHTQLGARPVVISVNGDGTYTIDITAACASVSCDASSACFAGACVDPSCTVDAPQNCPGITLCHADADCGSATSSCSVKHCGGGLCIATPTMSACGATEFCARDTGCAPDVTPVTMPMTGADPRCGTICAPTTATACTYSYYSCTNGANPVCSSFVNRPTGAPCGSALACDGVGNCTVAVVSDGGVDAGHDGSVAMCAVNNGGCDMLTHCTDMPSGGVTCSACPSGYTGSGTLGCFDINECATNAGGCDHLTTCTNTVGSFTCSACPNGYTGTGLAGCVDINECDTNHAGCAQTCTNADGTFACSCGAGFVLNVNGLACDDVNECNIGNGECAQTCTNTVGSYACSCGAGFVLDANAHSCNDVNECDVSNGGCAQTCTNTPGSYACGCSAAYSLDADAHTCDLNSDCTHKWLTQTTVDSNLKAFATAYGLQVGGFLSSGGGGSQNVYASADGHVLWSKAGEAYYGGGAGANYIASNLYGGSSVAFQIERAQTGEVTGSFSYSFVGGSASNFPPIGFSAAGDSLAYVNGSSIGVAWSGTLAGMDLTGSGSPSVLVHQSVTGAYLDSYQNPALTFYTPAALADGSWVVLAANYTGTDTTYGMHPFAAGTFQLLTLSNHLAYVSSVNLGTSFAYSSDVVISHSNVRLMGANGVTGYNSTSQIWNRSDCQGTFSPGVSGDVAYSALWLPGGVTSWCGETFASSAYGIAIAELDALTGATINVRWFPIPNGLFPGVFGIGADGTGYVTVPYTGTSAITICGDTTSAPGSAASAIFAF